MTRRISGNLLIKLGISKITSLNGFRTAKLFVRKNGVFKRGRFKGLD